MTLFRHRCVLAALMSACLAVSAQAQLNPYVLANNYPTTVQTQANQASFPANYNGPYGLTGESLLPPANAHQPQATNSLTSLIGGPPVAAPGADYGANAITPLGDYGVGSGAAFSDSYSSGYCGYPPPTLGRTGWFGSVAGLIMTRDRGNHYFYSYERTNEANQCTDARRAEIGWGGGFDVRFGHYFNCGQSAVQGVYWGLFPGDGSDAWTTDNITQLDAILNYSDLDYNGVAANLFTDDAEIHALRRDNEFHNIEVNLLQMLGGCGSGSCGPVSYNLLAGFRYFRFRDHLLFSADTVDRVFNAAVEEIHYNIDMTNNLIGFQLGAEGRFCATNRLTFDFGTKIGLFGNHVQHLSQIGGAAGNAVINNGPNLGREWIVDNTKDDVAFLAEVNLGARYSLSDCWTLFGGYRAVAVTGVGLPTHQIYHDLRGIQDVELVDTNGSLILHGGYFGAEYNF